VRNGQLRRLTARVLSFSLKRLETCFATRWDAGSGDASLAFTLLITDTNRSTSERGHAAKTGRYPASLWWGLYFLPLAAG